MDIKDAPIETLKASAWDATNDIKRLTTYVNAIVAELARREAEKSSEVTSG